ncbi:hypothetical protein K466DRAFT_218228 [Polyporus arcularius HHB13444]|uniref:Secreted protein n=1 Tax=Polyporus arcularius HHB13444 TaxID=1314778 RepID=A0A5C3PSV2_9APHY|nr:hypothetical protein K466DRAFT_218228 [Polyporus arcularius HHB13444]
MAPGADGRSVFARCIMLLLPCTTYATPHALLHTANICYVMHLKTQPASPRVYLCLIQLCDDINCSKRIFDRWSAIALSGPHCPCLLPVALERFCVVIVARRLGRHSRQVPRAIVQLARVSTVPW